MQIAFALCAVLFSNLTVYGEALWFSPDRKALASIESFALQNVIVCEFPAEANVEFVEHTDELEKWIRLAFGAYGIKVYSYNLEGTDEENNRFLDADAELHVRITDVLPLYLEDMYSYCVTIYVVDWVSTEENPDIHFKAISWADCRGSISSSSLLKSKVRDTLDKMLDKLIKDYLKEHTEQSKSNLSNLSDESRSNVEAGYNWLRVPAICVLVLVPGVMILNRRRKRSSQS